MAATISDVRSSSYAAGFYVVTAIALAAALPQAITVRRAPTALNVTGAAVGLFFAAGALALAISYSVAAARNDAGDDAH